MLPDRSPAVITTRRVPQFPSRPIRHRTDVSDSHSVPSHPVVPDRTIDVYPACPRLPPCNVTDPDPVPPRFDFFCPLSVPASNDIPMLPVPNLLSSVATTRRVPFAPLPTRHRTDVSDSHSVPSHPVSPDRTIDVYPARASPAPRTVTDPDPVPPRLLHRAKMSSVIVT